MKKEVKEEDLYFQKYQFENLCFDYEGWIQDKERILDNPIAATKLNKNGKEEKN